MEGRIFSKYLSLGQRFGKERFISWFAVTFLFLFLNSILGITTIELDDLFSKAKAVDGDSKISIATLPLTDQDGEGEGKWGQVHFSFRYLWHFDLSYVLKIQNSEV